MPNCLQCAPSKGTALLLFLLLAFSSGDARAIAPGHAWRTLESPHFVLHFHEGLYPMAVRSIRSLEEAHERLLPFFGKGPKRKTQVVLTDHTDDANGSATAFIRPRITLHASPPDDLSILGDFDDWVFILVAHEYAHVLHLGTTGGPTDWLTAIFGGLFNLNGMQPRFLVEGLATYQESLFSSAGRMRSSLAEMYLRADFLEGRVLSLGQLAGGPMRWPRGTAWYLYGGSLLSFLAETRGDEAIRNTSQSYGSSIVPYLIDPHLKAGADVHFSELWEEWKDASRLRYQGQAQAIALQGAVTVPEVRTSWGARTGSPRWAPEGRRLFYIEASEQRRPHLRLLDLDTGSDRTIREIGVSGSIAPLPGGDRVLLARQEIHKSYRFYGDLFLVDARGEKQITRGLRASEADAAADGSFAVFVRRGAGRTVLSRISLQDPERDPVALYEPPPGKQIYTPRLSSDGKRVVFSQDRHGPGRDLVVLSLEGGGEPQSLTDDDAIDLQPSWSVDGEKIYFSSDRSGVFNLYEVALPGGSIVQLTNVVSGAFQPEISPDGTWLAFTTYSSRGFDVAAAPLSSLSPRPVLAFASDREEGKLRLDGEIYPIRPYSPLETVAPLAWMPYLVLDGDQVVGANLWGSDVLGHHAWTFSLGYQLESKQPEAAATYGFHNWDIQPSVAIASADRRVNGFRDTFERVTSGSAFVSYPFGTVRTSQDFSLGYQATFFHDLRTSSEPVAPVGGVGAEARAGWSLSSYERPPDSISPEAGYSLSLTGRLGSQALGGDFDYRILTAQSSAYVRLPWARHHVLAFLGRAGTSDGDLGNRGVFALGGPLSNESPVNLLLNAGVLGESLLRGYLPGSFVGNHLVLGTVEYRFPIAWLDAAPGITPFYLGKVSGAVFAEAGDAFDSLPIERLHPSVGGELRLGFHLGWGAISASLRLGGAWGFDQDQGGGFRPYLGFGAYF